jgi:hypothetical protein
MPWNRVLRFADPLPCEAAVQGSDVEILPTKSGDFQTEIAQIGMNRLWMQRFHVALPQVSTVASKPAGDRSAFLSNPIHPRSSTVASKFCPATSSSTGLTSHISDQALIIIMV